MTLCSFSSYTRSSLLFALVVGFAAFTPARPAPASDLRHHTLATDARVFSQGSESTDGKWVPMLPQAIANHTAIYDPVRDRMVVFGGGDYLWAFSFSSSSSWTHLSPAGTPPGRGAAIYDPARDRMLVLDGSHVAALSLSGTPEWTSLSPAGTPPGGGTPVYDSRRDRMLVLDGSDVYALSLSGTPAWTEFVPTGTPLSSRYGSAAIYDPVGDRMVIFGGDDGSYPNRSDTWALALSGPPAWTQLTTVGAAPPRAGHTAIYDPVRDRMVVFGGTSDWLDRFNDAWNLSLSGSPSWTQLTPTGTPPAERAGHTAIYDPVRDRMVIFGGSTYWRYNYSISDVWGLSMSGSPHWAPVPGTTPSARGGHTAIYDSTRNRMLAFGGLEGLTSKYLDAVWALSLSRDPTWSQLAPTGTTPSPRYGHTAIYDPVRDRMVLFGGGDETSPVLNDLWVLSLSGTPKWTALTPGGTPPTPRSGHTAIYDPARDRMVVFGGDDNDVWTLSLSGSPMWTRQVTVGTSPLARTNHSAIYDPVRDRMLVLGGYGDGVFGAEVWALSLSGTPAWAQLAPAGTPPSARSYHTAIYDPVRDRMVIFGGPGEPFNYLNDAWALSLSGSPAWTQLTPEGNAPEGREAHTAIYDPVHDRMVLFGGVARNEWYNDVWALEWGTPIDTTPPTITVNLSRDMLWPPNHKLVEVCATVKVVDTVDAAPTLRLLTITSSAGNAADDIKGAMIGTPDLCYELRADRSREYRIIYQAKDASNNIACDTVSVRVPMNMANATALAGEPTEDVPTALSSIHPNPFNPEATVEYSLETTQRVVITIYDVSGSLVRRLLDQHLPAGEHRATWNGVDDRGRPASSGIYFVRMTAGTYTETRKIVMLK